MMRTGPIGSPAPLGLGVLRAHMWLTIVVWDCPANVNGDRLGDSAGQLGLKSLYLGVLQWGSGERRRQGLSIVPKARAHFRAPQPRLASRGRDSLNEIWRRAWQCTIDR